MNIPNDLEQSGDEYLIPLNEDSIPADVTFQKPKKCMGFFRKGAVTLCVLVGGAAGFTVGASIPSPTELVPHYLENAAYHSQVANEVTVAYSRMGDDFTADMIHPAVQNFIAGQNELKDQALNNKRALEEGGFPAFMAMAKAPKAVYKASKEHLYNARLVDFEGTWAPGLLLGGLGAIFAFGVSYGPLKKKEPVSAKVR